MENVIHGKVFVVGDNIDTDQIIPAEYLSYNPSIPEERKCFGKYAMSGVPITRSGLPGGHVPFVESGEFTSKFGLIVGGRNFGCGSSREHAPLAIAEAGVRVVVDVKSALYVSGSEIDFKDAMIGGGFKIHNPNATATCSCGESFSV